MEDLGHKFARKVREQRKKIGLTQAQVALRAGVTVETIARIERTLSTKRTISSNSNPTLDTVEKIALALEVTPVSLLSERTTMSSDSFNVTAVLRSAEPEVVAQVLVIARALVAHQRSTKKPTKNKRR